MTPYSQYPSPPVPVISTEPEYGYPYFDPSLPLVPPGGEGAIQGIGVTYYFPIDPEDLPPNPNAGDLIDLLNIRLSELGWNPPDLVRQYALERGSNGHWKTRKPYRNAVIRTIRREVDPHWSTVVTILRALGGSLIWVQWDDGSMIPISLGVPVGEE